MSDNNYGFQVKIAQRESSEPNTSRDEQRDTFLARALIKTNAFPTNNKKAVLLSLI